MTHAEGREANRIILGWGAAATPTHPGELSYYGRPRPGCRRTRADGFACWGEVPHLEDCCWRHVDDWRYQDQLEGRAEAVAFAKDLARQRTTGPGVYFIVGGDLVKIGVAHDPQARLATLQCGSPVRLEMHRTVPTASADAVERRLHKLFREHRRHGEWFDAAAVLSTIDALSDEQIRALGGIAAGVLRGPPDVLARWFGAPVGFGVYRAVPPIEVRADGHCPPLDLESLA